VSWTDATGNVLLAQPGSNGTTGITGLAPGDYAVRVEGNTGCGTLVRAFTIEEPAALEAAPTTSDATCPNTPDGLASVDVLGGTAPYAYAWSNGGTTAAIMAGAGTYAVAITDANGCTLDVQGLAIGSGPGPVAFFEMENPTAIAGRAIVFVNMGDAGESVHWDFGDGGTSTDAMGRHTYTLPGTYTVTLTVFAAGCSDSFSLDVDVQTSTGISDGGKVPALHVWTDGQRFLVDLPFTDGRNVAIEVLDATGRLHIQRQVPGFPGRTAIPAEGLSTGVWFVRVQSGDEQKTFRVPLLR